MGKMNVLSFKPPKNVGLRSPRMKETWVPMVVTFLQATFDHQGVLFEKNCLARIGRVKNDL